MSDTAVKRRPRPDVFSARELRNRSGELLRDAEEGRMAVVTRYGRPAMLVVPFDQRLLDLGVHRAVALSLFEEGTTTLAQSAKLAGLSLEGFIELLGELGIAAVDYPAEELEGELQAAR